MRYTHCLIVLFVFTVNALSAQKGLDGVWEGTITIGGIYSSQPLPMQLYLTVNGKSIEGRSYVQIKEGETVQMDLRGSLYKDNSMQMAEIKFVGDESNPYFPKFNRQYQLIWKRDLWEAQLIGFWQEVTDHTFYNYRERGRIQLKKIKNKGV